MNNPKIRFTNGNRTPVMSELRKAIDAYFTEKNESRYANAKMKRKIALIFGAFLGSYMLILFSGSSFPLYLAGMCLFGLFSAMIAFNVGHDASHGAISSSRQINRIFSYSFNLIGVNSYIWNLKHNVSHHSYTNMPGLDMDIQQVKIARLVPAVPLKKMHRFQHIYVPLLYPFASLYLILVKDFMMFLNPHFAKQHPRREYFILVISKLIYFFYAVVIPFYVVDLSLLQLLAGLLCMHLLLGVFVATILFPVHAQEDSLFSEPDSEGMVSGDWAVLQIESTTNFAAESRLIGWLSGGLNTHIIHHLFPGICHIHYYELTRIIRGISKKHGLVFRDRTIGATVYEHWKFLRTMGRNERLPGKTKVSIETPAMAGN